MKILQTDSGPSTTTVHPLERFLGVLGAAVCLVITIAIWLSVSTYQGMWPLPGLYFIELPAVGIVSALAIVRGNRYAGVITWAAVGIFAAFSIVGAWSVGLFYLPVTLVFGVVSVAYDVRNKQPIAAHLGVCFTAALVQAAVMFALIALL